MTNYEIKKYIFDRVKLSKGKRTLFTKRLEKTVAERLNIQPKDVFRDDITISDYNRLFRGILNESFKWQDEN